MCKPFSRSDGLQKGNSSESQIQLIKRHLSPNLSHIKVETKSMLAWVHRAHTLSQKPTIQYRCVNCFPLLPHRSQYLLLALGRISTSFGKIFLSMPFAFTRFGLIYPCCDCGNKFFMLPSCIFVGNEGKLAECTLPQAQQEYFSQRKRLYPPSGEKKLPLLLFPTCNQSFPAAYRTKGTAVGTHLRVISVLFFFPVAPLLLLD